VSCMRANILRNVEDSWETHPFRHFHLRIGKINHLNCI
jgi:hypothetical protein